MEDGKTWRAIKWRTIALQAELAAIDFEQALATEQAEDGETGEDGD